VLRVFVRAEANLVPNYILTVKARVPSINGCKSLMKDRKEQFLQHVGKKTLFRPIEASASNSL
jgi:hypothetical protein